MCRRGSQTYPVVGGAETSPAGIDSELKVAQSILTRVSSPREPSPEPVAPRPSKRRGLWRLLIPADEQRIDDDRPSLRGMRSGIRLSRD